MRHRTDGLHSLWLGSLTTYLPLSGSIEFWDNLSDAKVNQTLLSSHRCLAKIFTHNPARIRRWLSMLSARGLSPESRSNLPTRWSAKLGSRPRLHKNIYPARNCRHTETLSSCFPSLGENPKTILALLRTSSL